MKYIVKDLYEKMRGGGKENVSFSTEEDAIEYMKSLYLIKAKESIAVDKEYLEHLIKGIEIFQKIPWDYSEDNEDLGREIDSWEEKYRELENERN